MCELGVSVPGQNPDDNAEGDEGLSAREIRFVDALATGSTPHEAAKAVGISDRTGRRWRQKSEIRAAIKARLNDAVAVGRSILASGFAQAATALVGMAGGTVPADAPRIAACRVVTEAAVKLATDDLENRLAALETAVRSTRQ